jgi:hypothetical protein
VNNIDPPLVLTSEIGPIRADSALNLRRYLRSSRKWAKLRNILIEEFGAFCHICKDKKRKLHAHEVWEYVDACKVGCHPAQINNAIQHQNEIEKELYSILDRIRSSRGAPSLERRFTKNAVVMQLVEIQIICQKCHVCKHSYDIKYLKHWCKTNRRSPDEFHKHYKSARDRWKGAIVIDAQYSQYDKLPLYKTFREWAETAVLQDGKRKAN